tara:strand:- start:30225 stop:30470 length:246 start_codon:yes stop_codon:yes gene_type:complete
MNSETKAAIERAKCMRKDHGARVEKAFPVAYKDREVLAAALTESQAENERLRSELEKCNRDLKLADALLFRDKKSEATDEQ